MTIYLKLVELFYMGVGACLFLYIFAESRAAVYFNRESQLAKKMNELRARGEVARPLTEEERVEFFKFVQQWPHYAGLKQLVCRISACGVSLVGMQKRPQWLVKIYIFLGMISSFALVALGWFIVAYIEQKFNVSAP